MPPCCCCRAPPGVFLSPSPWAWIDPGAFALIGAGAFMGGVTRLTISLAVIMMEVSTADLPRGILQQMAPCLPELHVRPAPEDVEWHSGKLPALRISSASCFALVALNWH